MITIKKLEKMLQEELQVWEDDRYERADARQAACDTVEAIQELIQWRNGERIRVEGTVS